MDRQRKILLQLDLIKVIVRRESERLAPGAMAEVRGEALRILAELEAEAGRDEELLHAIRAARDEVS